MRFIPSAIQAKLDSGVTTLCRLLKITLQNGTVTGMAALDRDVVYQAVTYSAVDGFDSSVIASDASFSVDNAEGYALISGSLLGITEAMVKRGEMEGGEWEMLLVDYNDLSAGHVTLDAGDLGEIRLVDGQVFMPELLSYAMRLRQTIGHVDSRTCRAIFGNPDIETQLGCGVDISALWVGGTVSGVDTEEPKRVFAADVSQAPPARLEWLTGNNASSKIYQIEAVDSGSNTSAILEPLPFVIEVGDTFRVRPNCDQTLANCRDVWNNMINFKGEPLIPVGEASHLPGAGVA